MQSGMWVESVIKGVKNVLQPDARAEHRVRNMVFRRVQPFSSLLEVRSTLDVPIGLRPYLWQRVLKRLQPVRLMSPVYRVFKGGLAFIILVLFVRIVPALITAESTTARSSVLLLPTDGEVSLSTTERSWEDVVAETELSERSLIRTRAGEATVILHDDGVVRLAPFTAVEIHDLSDRPKARADMPTLTLIHGTVWIQGLLPPHVSPLIVSTSYGDVAIHEGSVSIEEGTAVVVRVWDRRATVIHKDVRLPLVAGERTWLWEDNMPMVKRIALTDAESSWSAQNIGRDEAHRRDVATWQYERRAGLAGILPSSPLYPAKRVAEEVDVFLTLGKEARLKKKLHLADKRFNEAAAVLAEGGDVESSLDAYTSVLLALAGDSTDGMLPALIEDALKENTAAVSAVTPDSPGYRLKRAVLEAHAAVAFHSGGTIATGDIEGILLIDSLNTLVSALRKGEDIALDIRELETLSPYLALLEDSSSKVRSDIRKEARALLEAFAVEVLDRNKVIGDVSDGLLVFLKKYLPPVETSSLLVLSDDEVQHIIADIVDRVLTTFTMRRSRENQLFAELRALNGHPDQARILRRLYQAFADQPWYAAYVREEMKKLNERVL